MSRSNLLHTLLTARDPDAAAFEVPASDLTVDTRAWRSQVGRMATALASLQIGPGSRVSFQLSKSLDALSLAHACFQLGAVAQPINSTYTAVETRYMLDDVEPALVVCEDARRAWIERLVPPGRRVETLSVDGLGSLGDLARVSTPRDQVADVSDDTVAAILYTSGTTGKPKGAQITHGNLATSARALAEVWGLEPHDRLLHVLPIYHANGLLTSINVMLCAGGSVVLFEKFEATEAVEALSDATVFMAVPTHYGRLLREPHLEHSVNGRLRLAISGSAPLSCEIAHEFRRRTGCVIVERYGSTETAIVTAVPAGTEGRDGWVGWALPGVQIRVTREDGTRADRSAVGVLETRGDNVFFGYWRRPEADSEAFTGDGWFVTGDIAEIDETGCVRLLGRARDLIISGGLNVYPQEVEAALDMLPCVSESAVFGLPHPDFGEACVAVVRLKAGALLDESLAIGALREQLAGYKVPKKLIAVDEIPRNGNGKVLKTQLRDQYRDLFASAAD